MRGLLIPEAQCYFRAVILAVTAAINFYVYDPVEAGKIGVYIVGLFGGNIPDLIAVDIDTESRLALPFFPLQSQFHCALVERFVFEVDFSQDGLTAFAPVFEGNARNLHGKKFKNGLCFICGCRGEQRSGGIFLPIRPRWKGWTNTTKEGVNFRRKGRETASCFCL